MTLIDPGSFLSAAIRAVPAIRYALGVGGIAAIVAIIAGFQIDYRVTIFGTAVVFGLMFVLVVFAKQTSSRQTLPGIRLIFLLLTVSFSVLLVAATVLLFTSTFFDWPKTISRIFSMDVISPLSPSNLDENRTAQIDLCAYTRKMGIIIECVTHGACRGPGAEGLGFAIDKTSVETAEYSCKQACAAEAARMSAQCGTPPPF